MNSVSTGGGGGGGGLVMTDPVFMSVGERS
jgi:hypothetical protein